MFKLGPLGILIVYMQVFRNRNTPLIEKSSRKIEKTSHPQHFGKGMPNLYLICLLDNSEHDELILLQGTILALKKIQFKGFDILVIITLAPQITDVSSGQLHQYFHAYTIPLAVGM